RLRLFGSQAAHFPVILCLFHLIYTPYFLPCWCDNLGTFSRITILTPLTMLYHSRWRPNSCAANIQPPSARTLSYRLSYSPYDRTFPSASGVYLSSSSACAFLLI